MLPHYCNEGKYMLNRHDDKNIVMVLKEALIFSGDM